MSDALAEARELVQNRLNDLNEEQGRLEGALKALDGGVKRGRPAGRRPSGTGSRKPSTRKRRGGTRADEAVKLITDKPGITASDIAKAMKIKPNYLYRVLSDLEKQKRVKKKGRTYSPAS